MPLARRTEILITGGCGFVGHHLALALKGLGMNVTVFDDFRFDLKLPAYRKFIEMRFRKLDAAKIPIIHGDTADLPTVTAVVERLRPAKVVHLNQ
jgi:nucleoside-diphosphate-sugar epimerase